ncbi:hypothetical protein FLM48_04825 [Shewanella sp. Scap07]|uniref:hypothetical protein n=1 Tax=Shewanella sp. Scap07 TaxID=2589987 RepID=UPI0015B9A066|nr:hypothetical protein [Shewanella sp. Scap07]QLE84472.1 hypothetical protein FLM48_04825 [Shewanella sp. Scap07]
MSTNKTMSTITQLLEQLGQDASLQIDTAQRHAAITSADISNELKQALIQGDSLAVKNQLDVCPDVYCVFVAHEDEDDTGESDNSSQDNNPVIEKAA